MDRSFFSSPGARRQRFAMLVVLGLFASTTSFSGAAQKESEKFRKGVLHGKVLGPDGKPVAGATVALAGKDGKVLTWTKTDEKGEYALGADPKLALNLRPSRRRGLLEACIRTAGDVAMAPVKAAGEIVTKPGETVKSVGTSVATGTPAPLAGQAVGAMLPNKSTAEQTKKSARDAAVNVAAGNGGQAAATTGQKGQASLVVSAAGFKDARVAAGGYWLEAPSGNKEHPMGMQAWLETIKMAAVAAPTNSEVVQEALTVSEPVVEPSLVPAGGTVKLRVRVNFPAGADREVRVFAREGKKGTVVELLPEGGTDKSVYVANMTLDPKAPVGETTISIGALRAKPVEVRLDPKKPDPLKEFVRRVDDMDAKKAYEYDPLIMASENRVDVKVTVLPPPKG